MLEDHDGDTYRAVYTLRYAGLIFVLHAFKKKSKSDRAVPREDRKLIEQRLKAAEQEYIRRRQS